MDAVVEQMATEYDEVQKVGQRMVRDRWRFLQASTQKSLEGSGWYSGRGERLTLDEFQGGREPEDHIERLEIALGRFKLCAGANLPTRKDKGATIPPEALTDDVLTSCEDVLSVLAWHDPAFLRLALLAIAVHQEAQQLTMVGPKSPDGLLSHVLALIGGLIKLALVFAAPWAAAAGIAAANRQDVGSAAVDFYIVAAALWAVWSSQDKARKGSVSERAYGAWQHFRYSRAFGVVGAAATRELERMAGAGVPIPHVAFDLCEALRYRMQGAAVCQ